MRLGLSVARSRALGVRVAGLASLLHAEDAGLVNRGRQGEAQEAGLTPIKNQFSIPAAYRKSAAAVQPRPRSRWAAEREAFNHDQSFRHGQGYPVPLHTRRKVRHAIGCTWARRLAMRTACPSLPTSSFCAPSRRFASRPSMPRVMLRWSRRAWERALREARFFLGSPGSTFPAAAKPRNARSTWRWCRHPLGDVVKLPQIPAHVALRPELFSHFAHRVQAKPAAGAS